MSIEQPKVNWVSYVMLFLAILIFSGAFTNSTSMLRVIDFPTLLGKFGVIGGTKDSFMGSGGSGARFGFLFALNLIPSLMLALGIVKIVDGHGGLLAAERLISPMFRPLLGIPGICGLAFITSLQSTDGAAGMTKELYDSKAITDQERTLFCQLQFSANGTITNYFATVGGLFALFAVPIFAPLAVMFICKGIGTNLMRLVLAWDQRKNPDAA